MRNVQGELSRATLNRARKNRPQWLALLAALRLGTVDGQGCGFRGGVSRVVESLRSDGMELTVPLEGRG